ncbi:Amidohydrolase EgtC [Actinomadura rubteroloni]|uniref:Gamma-glutamyl-hercynylcysteine sulfoxide hydrolase n=1 Tax=Actinomadura rubteroloni TaxID=1926885 RepID=A0A2P4UI36_9ACTN|nr:ergothioneine biosynthesis protein EgtC [Actinomadura rubteroloni]POM24686.1 Amidohydrolase EgtC [Actinomadura rubteroloni]
MCRHLAYVGPPRTLRSLVHDGDHSLEHQSYAPRMNVGNVLNADGFGVGWYGDGPTPSRFRRRDPLWTDVSFREIAGSVATGCAVAAVRSATVGFPVDESCAQPFRAGTRLFSHNGIVQGFADVEGKLRELAAGGPAEPDARAPVDSALLFALAARYWADGADLGTGLAEVVRTVTGLTGGRYNLLAADGTALAATTCGDSLFVRETPGAVEIASEPTDGAPGWRPVPDRALVRATASGAETTPLEGDTWTAS